jgi:glutathione S-transferase
MLRLVIGDRHLSSWSFRAWLALRKLGLGFEEIRLQLDTPGFRDAIRRYSPALRVPVLLDGELTVWDTLAIGEYANELAGGRGWPAERAARARARSISAEMHSGFAALREHCPMELLARTPMAALPDAVAAEVRRIVAIWHDCQRRFGASGSLLFGGFTAADAMYAPVATRFRTYLPDLAPYGDDGTAQAYVDALFALPAMAEWEAGAHRETSGPA